jgi:hypothetical protein
VPLIILYHKIIIISSGIFLSLKIYNFENLAAFKVPPSFHLNPKNHILRTQQISTRLGRGINLCLCFKKSTELDILDVQIIIIIGLVERPRSTEKAWGFRAFFFPKNTVKTSKRTIGAN